MLIHAKSPDKNCSRQSIFCICSGYKGSRFGVVEKRRQLQACEDFRLSSFCSCIEKQAVQS